MGCSRTGVLFLFVIELVFGFVYPPRHDTTICAFCQKNITNVTRSKRIHKKNILFKTEWFVFVNYPLWGPESHSKGFLAQKAILGGQFMRDA